jgi:hypothetical protein
VEADLLPWTPISEMRPDPLVRYQTDPVLYASEQLGLTPWSGCTAKGQLELFQDIAESVELQLAGLPATRIFRVEAGNGIGKTLAGAMLVNWWFDSFAPGICITTAPSRESVEQLLWKDIKAMRPSSLPGRVLPAEPRMVKGPNHWAVGKATSNAKGTGEERFKGQHQKYLMFVLDEAEGLGKFVFDAVHRMMTGAGVILCLIFANPRTRTSEFFKWGDRPGVANYRLSALDFPNVVHGTEIVPGATSRAWVDGNIDSWCEAVGEHSEDDYTFEVAWRPGLIYKPNHEFLCAVMGIPPANSSDDTMIPSGRFDGAATRGKALWAEMGSRLDLVNALGQSVPPVVMATAQFAAAPLRIGVDVARWGLDHGTVYARCGELAWRVAKLSKKDTDAYVRAIKTEALRLLDSGVCTNSLHVRVDAGGGYGSGVIDGLRKDEELKAAFTDFRVVEVHNNGSPYSPRSYADLVTEMYAAVSESLLGLMVLNPPSELGPDLTERKYGWKQVRTVAVKVLESKDELRKPERLGRSPDDGDGFVLAVSPDFLFGGRVHDVF